MKLIRSSCSVLALCAVLGLAACGSDKDTKSTTTTAAASAATTIGSTPASSPTSTGGAAAVEGTTWTLTSDSKLGVDLGTVDVTMRLENGTVAGSSGCNRFTGSYTLDGQSLTIKPGVASTMMACPDPQMAVEQAFLRLLPTMTTAQVSGETLQLSDASGQPILVFQQVSGEQAIAGDWTVTAVRTANAVSSPVPGSELTLSFASGTASGYAGCNQFTGGYTLTGEDLTIGPLASTRRACADPAVSQQETDYLAALQATASFSATSQMLTLLAADGTITVTAMRADPSASSVPHS
jgi:heat shock protein HslJ